MSTVICIVQPTTRTCIRGSFVHTDTRAYVDCITRGDYEGAFEKIREFNPFPSVCSLVCHHPCEQQCRRQFVDAPVALRNLKRFATERALDYRQRTREEAEQYKPKEPYVR